MGNFFAEEVVAFYNTCTKDHDFIKARKIMAALLPLTTLLEGGGQLIQCTKFACELFGLPAGTVRPPMQPLDASAGEDLAKVLKSARADIKAILSA